MAHPIDESEAPWNKLGGVNAFYPWNDWFDGQVWLVEPDDVIEGSTFRDLAAYATKVAKRRGITIRTRRGDYDPITRTYGCLYIKKTSDNRRAKNRKKAHDATT